MFSQFIIERGMIPVPSNVVIARIACSPCIIEWGVCREVATVLRFITDKNVDAVKDFYQAEELLHIIAVFPVFFDLFMNKVRVVQYFKYGKGILSMFQNWS